MDEQVTLSRDVDVITIPFGAKTNLKKGQNDFDLAKITFSLARIFLRGGTQKKGQHDEENDESKN